MGFFKNLIVVSSHRFIHVTGMSRLGDVPHTYGNLTHERKIVNAVDSLLDSLSSIRVCFFLGGEEAAPDAALVGIVGGGEKHWSISAFGTPLEGKTCDDFRQ